MRKLDQKRKIKRSAVNKRNSQKELRVSPELTLEDGATRIFLNTRGTNDDEVSKELREFLHYLEWSIRQMRWRNKLRAAAFRRYMTV